MNRGLLPFVLAVVLIAVVTVVEGVYLKDRWGTPGVEAAELGQRFAQVPKKIGDWTGIDMPVSRDVKERSGAVHFVNRRYTQEGTDRSVDLWLIIGHSRDIIRHTPDICYASSGFRQQGSQLRYTVNYNGDKEARFFTSKFIKEDSLVRQMQRVFWAWNHPDIQKWDAPDKARFHYGMSTRTLYKMYFTSRLTTDEDTLDDSPAAEFANLVLPVIDAALFSEQPTATSSPESRVESPEPEVESPEPG
ncbi:MAG: exosortase-associated EpsI family protein [Planctomycetes bacterium]|nr:exosortase-associated EpsI family protein [Planctomycetota bacterium]